MKKIARTDDDINGCLIDRESRTLYLYGPITRRLASKFRKLFFSLEKESNLPITIELNTPGGEVDAGNAIADTIMLSLCQTLTVAAGEACSMGAVILAAGSSRTALPRTTIMIHPTTWKFSVKDTELENEIQAATKTIDMYWRFLDSRTEKPSGYWKALCANGDRYLTAAEALEHNLINYIVESNQ